jgi:hypothetical protein
MSDNYEINPGHWRAELHLKQIEEEYGKACLKHPFFAHYFCDAYVLEKSTETLCDLRSNLRKQIGLGNVSAMAVLQCEIWEAIEAYHNRDYEACLQELAQCAAVVLRNMELVEKMEKEVTP